MLKKLLSISLSVFLFSLFVANHSFAYILPVNTCSISSTSYDVSVVSEIDLAGSIPLCVNANANLPVNTSLQNSDMSLTQIHTTGAAGNDMWSYVKNFDVVDMGGENNFNFVAVDTTGAQAVANVTINITPATITLTPSPSIAEGETIDPYTSESFTCTNATELYYDNVLQATDYTGASGYNLSYTVTPTNGSHTVECDNIGGAMTREILNFNVGAGMSGVVSASNCSIAVGASSCSSTVSWNTYSPVSTSAVTSETDGSGLSSPGNVIGSANSGSMNVNIPYIVLGSHQGRNFYLYNDGIELANATALAECVSGSSWDGTKCAEPIDPDTDPTDPDPTQCVLPNYIINTPSGTICSQCSTGSVYDDINHTCIVTSSIPYTHFLSFNASAGNIKKGTGIDFNWSIQKPDNSCKIVGVAIANGAIVFNSEDYSAINASVTGDGLSPNLSAGSYKSKIGSYFTVNQSTRFTASCITPEESYNPGYHQLVRDVYVIGEKER